MLIKSRFSIFLFALFLFASCNKQTQEPLEEKEGVITEYQYFFDGEKVGDTFFNPEDENLLIAVTAEPSANPEEGLVKIWAFTSEDKYIAWGETHNTPVTPLLEMEKHLRQYIIDNNVEQIYEGVNATERGSAMLHKDCTGGSSAPLLATLPAMWPGWNNRVSSYFPFGIYSGLMVFDRSFYRSRMAIVWNWGWTRYCFSGPLGFLNDRMSSAII